MCGGCGDGGGMMQGVEIRWLTGGGTADIDAEVWGYDDVGGMIQMAERR